MISSASINITKAQHRVENGDRKAQRFRKVTLNCEALKIYNMEDTRDLNLAAICFPSS